MDLFSGEIACPACSYCGSKVKDSRGNKHRASIRRRRMCLKCGYRFTTRESLTGGVLDSEGQLLRIRALELGISEISTAIVRLLNPPLNESEKAHGLKIAEKHGLTERKES